LEVAGTYPLYSKTEIPKNSLQWEKKICREELLRALDVLCRRMVTNWSQKYFVKRLSQ